MKKKDVNCESPLRENSSAGLSIDRKTVITISVLLLSLWILAGVLTRVLPIGVYDTDADGGLIPGTYHAIDESFRLPVWRIILSPVLCFGSSYALIGVGIIAVIILVGGAFLLLDKSGVLAYMIAALVRKFSKHKYLLMAIVMFFGMFLSSVAGILEESVTLVPLTVAIALSLGWDSLVGLGMSIVSIAWGFTAATFNPFNVVTVQKLCDLPVYSGLWLRCLIFVGVYIVLYVFLFTYARKIEKNPEKSPVYESDRKLREKFVVSDTDAVLQNASAEKGARIFLICMLLDLVCIAVDLLVGLGGYLSLGGMAVLFTTGGLLAGYHMGIRGKKLVSEFLTGAKTLLPVVPLILFVVAIAYILNEGNIMHTILNSVASFMENLNGFPALLIIFALVAVLEFFIGSGTAKAFLIMPLVAPLSDLVGVSRQSVVTAFCLADGFTNLLYPTSGIMIIAIGLIGVSYSKWIKWTWKLFLGEFLLSVLIMFVMIKINYGPF